MDGATERSKKEASLFAEERIIVLRTTELFTSEVVFPLLASLRTVSGPYLSRVNTAGKEVSKVCLATRRGSESPRLLPSCEQSIQFPEPRKSQRGAGISIYSYRISTEIELVE